MRIRKGLITALFALGLSVSSAGLVACGDKETSSIQYTFETNGGVEISVMDAEAGENITLPTPERAGYEFEGWYTNPEFTGAPVTTVVAESSATYYAKWAQLYTVTLDLQGGSLASKTVSLKAGANVYKAVAELAPTKEAAQFGVWLYNGAEITKNLTMPEGGITLTAKYKVAYTAEIWVENTETGEYEKDQEIVSYEYAGVEVTSSQKLVGLKEVKHDNTLVKLVLSENAAENVFKHYYTREKFEVRFDPNAPDGSSLGAKSVEVVYGGSTEVPSDYAVEGYCLIGWATSKTGDVVYKANYIEEMLFNREGEVQPADSVSPERDTTLYGVWAKGYEDMFGNDDYIYVLSSDATVAYLSRGGIFFQGTYKADAKEFIFLVNGEIKKGRLFESTFAYSDADRAAKTFQLYEVGVGLIEDGATISLNEYNGLTYYQENPETGNKEPSTGTYVIEDDVYFVATFTDGMMAGKTITFIIGTVSEERKPAFQLRKDDEYNLGTLHLLYVSETGKLEYYEESYLLTLNGFGTATYYQNADTYTTYNYTYEDGVIALTNSNGQSVGNAHVIEVNGVMGYSVKDDTYAHVYEMDGGETFEMNGLYTGTYKNANGDVLFEGNYKVIASAFGGYIATVFAENGESKKFLLSQTTVEIPSEEEGKTETQTKYSAEEKLSSYYEYYYQNENATYYAPLIALNDPEEGKATMYGYTNAKTYEKVADCTYEYDQTTGLYVFNVTPVTYSEAVFTETVDYATLKSFVCALDKDSTSYSVSYWYTVETEGGSTDYRKYYYSENGELMLVGGFAFYTANGVTVSGPYSMSGTMMAITTKSGAVYLEMDEENKTFLVLSDEPYKSYGYINGQSDKTQFLTFDGKGGVKYTITAENKDEENTVYEGTAEKLAETTFAGSPIYLFVSGDFSFKYIALATSTQQFFAPYNETQNGKYESDDGILEIDGFAFNAKFTANDGTVYEGRYTIDEENSVINFLYEEETWYFDMDFEGREFTLRGAEALTYVLVDNQLFQGLYLEMDGYGKLTVYKLEAQEGAEESVRVDVDANGSYEIDGDVYTLRYKNGAEEVTLVGEIGLWASSGYVFRSFMVSHKEVVRVYVNEEDWSVLILDDVGNAIKYDGKGMKDTGKYTIVTDNMLYFVNDSSTDACIYNYSYDEETGKAIAIPSSFTAIGYFTKDLESLLFSQYGFAIFNGADYYYYEIVNSDYLIYRQDPTNEKANAYGFVQDNFGPLADKKIYEDKEYMLNTGYAITFGREEATKEDYPVSVGNTKKPLEDIIFTPSGDGEFEVTCVVKLNGQNITGTAVRKIDENGNVETYVLLAANMGYYRFDIELTYTGLDKQEMEDGDTRAYNSYKVTGMKWIRSIYSYQYLQTYYLYYMFFGASYAYSYENNIGMMYLNQEFTADGESSDIFVESKFFEGSELYDTNGELLSIEKGTYAPYKDWANYYRSTFVGADGYTYHFYFMIQQHSAFKNTYGYRVYAFTREETLTTEDGYEVVIEKVVGSESSVKVGSIFDVQLKKDGEELKAEAIMYKDNYVYYIVREKSEDGVITSTKYYKLLLTEEGSDDSGSIGGEEEEESKVIPLYVKVEVTEQIVSTIYTEDGASFVDISEEGVTLYSANGTQNAVVESVYDEATATYTITLVNGKKYAIEVIEVEGNEKVTITEVVEAEEESGESEEA